MQVSTSYMPSGLPSPTLTNPDMILPFDSPSPGSSPLTLRRPQRIPSPPPIDLAHSAETNGTEDPNHLKGAMRNFFRNGERSKLRKARVLEGVSPDAEKRRDDNSKPNGTNENSVLASPPTLHDNHAMPAAGSAMLGEGERSQWHEFSSNADGDATSPFSEGSQEGILDMGRPTYGFPPLDNEKNGFTAPPDVEDDDPYSHAAMSIRAEQILANAKKRLTNMEGNLSRARSTLHSRPSSSMSSFNNRDNEAVSMYSLPNANSSQAKHRQANTPPSAGSNKGHARVFSETSVPSTLYTPSSQKKENGNSAPRSSSAMGSTSQEKSGNDNMDNPRSWFWTGLIRSASQPHKHNYSLPALDEDGPAPASFEPYMANGRISEENEEPKAEPDVDREGPSEFDGQNPPGHTLTRARSTTQMRDLRDQMQDLKSKISSLKQRAREDSLRRRSLQSLRTPSPFTAAEQWYSNSAPIAQTEFATNSASHSRSPASSPDPQNPEELAIAEEGGLPAEEKSDLRLSPEVEDQKGESDFDLTPRNNAAMQTRGQSAEESEVLTPSPSKTPGISKETVHSNGDQPSSPGIDSEEDSLYGDQDYHETSPSPLGERHEDRPDAFDYEHFFLHSGTGTLARKDLSRSSSRSSIYSVETTKPSNAHDRSATEDDSEESSSTAELTPKRAPQQKGYHSRNGSVGSISTVATFATATEGQGSDGEASEDEWILHHPIAGAWQPEQNKRKHARNAIPDSKRHATPKAMTSTDAEPVPSVPSPYRRPSATQLSALLALLEASLPPNDDGSKATLKIGDADKDLVEKLINSLANVCARLQTVDAEGGRYEGRVWRRRLDSARRVLDGEMNGEPF